MKIGNSAKLNWSSSQIFSRAMVKIAIIVINITSRALLLIASGALLLVRRRALVLALRLWEALSAGPGQNCFIMNHEYGDKLFTIAARKYLLFKLLLTITRLPKWVRNLTFPYFVGDRTRLQLLPPPLKQSVDNENFLAVLIKMMMTTTMMKTYNGDDDKSNFYHLPFKQGVECWRWW